MIPNIDDLGRVIQQIAASETRKQIQLGNPPQQIIVDNKKGKPFNEADYRIVVNFNDSKMIAHAAMGAIVALQKVIRKASGTASKAFQIWTVKDKRDPGKLAYSNGSAVSLTSLENLAEGLPPGGRIVVAGAMVDYGRKLYWNPKTRKNSKRTVRSRMAAYDADTGQILTVRSTRTKNMNDIAVRAVRRKFPGISVIGRWVHAKSVGTHRDPDKWPGIGVGLPQGRRI